LWFLVFVIGYWVFVIGCWRCARRGCIAVGDRGQNHDPEMRCGPIPQAASGRADSKWPKQKTNNK
jgi:hypothetical protein